MIPRDSNIGKRVRLVYGTGGVVGRGKIIGYQLQPTFIVKLDNGEQIHWAASLTEEEPLMSTGRWQRMIDPRRLLRFVPLGRYR